MNKRNSIHRKVVDVILTFFLTKNMCKNVKLIKTDQNFTSFLCENTHFYKRYVTIPTCNIANIFFSV